MSFLSRPLLFAGSLAFPILGILFFLPVPSTSETRPASPHLAVLVVFDQLRGDYLERWDDLYGDGGFHRLEKEGAWFQNCHYPYASTLTGCGHASLATGCSPDVHGIIANDWLEGDKMVNCVSDPEGRYERIPPVPPKVEQVKETDTSEEKRYPVAPTRLRAPAIGEAVKIATGGKGRVVCLSFKDRGAVLPAGRNEDAACYWLDTKDGTFVTSSYYGGKYRSWARAMNEHRDEFVDHWFGKEWDRLRPDLDYPKRSQEDDTVIKSKGTSQGMTFPHPFDGGAKKEKKVYYSQLYNSPQGNELLLELVKKAVEGENLGRHETPDLLCVSFSSNDAVGHNWGPDSQEVLDTTLRTDLIVRDLLAFLDKQVGRGRYTLVLSADHGVCPIPESKTGAGTPEARHSVKELRTAADLHLAEKFGGDEKTRYLAGIAYPWVYLNQQVLKDRQLDATAVENELANWLKTQPGVKTPGIETAFTRRELSRRDATTDKSLRKMRRSYRPEVCGQVGFVVKRDHIFWTAKGTTHGSPHPYDTRVPLLVVGPGVKPGIHTEHVEPLSAAPILARALGIAPPAKATAEVPEALFEAR